jgi:tetratricopeptide (TPR) repeat protein
MRLAVLFVCTVFLLSAVLSGCKRSAQRSSVAPAESGGSSNGVAEGKSQARAYLEKGKLLYQDDDDSGAAQAFEQAIKLDPDLAEAHFRLGLTYEALARSDDAEAAYKKAIESYKKYLADNSEDAEAHYDLGQAYANLHQYSEAVREYRQAIKLKDKDDAAIYYDLGMALTRLAQYEEAVAAFSKSLEIDPDNYRAEDALEEAREGVNRIKVGRKHQVDLLKKKKEEELKKAAEAGLPVPPTPVRPTPVKRP